MMSKVNNNKIVVRPQTVYLKNLVQTIENSVDYSAQKNKVIKTFTIGENIPDKIVVDPNILSEILINLIENAIKFTKNGKVETTIELNENYSDEDSVLSIRFSVIDNGIGIPKNKRKEIFQKFSQLHSDKDMLTGTGIGLSLVTSLLDLLDTKIKLISKVGNGSIFYFDLLCKLPSKHNTKQISESNLINFQGKKILLVEDNEINKMVIKKFLSSCNIDLEIISDGLLAFEALSENDYDLVLLDINIPSMDGYKVAEGARSLGINVPIIAVTASEYTEIEDKVKQAGINDILIKPFQKKNLEDLLIKFLN
jgi:CheY-like chemotaxis protein